MFSIRASDNVTTTIASCNSFAASSACVSSFVIHHDPDPTVVQVHGPKLSSDALPVYLTLSYFSSSSQRIISTVVARWVWPPDTHYPGSKHLYPVGRSPWWTPSTSCLDSLSHRVASVALKGAESAGLSKLSVESLRLRPEQWFCATHPLTHSPRGIKGENMPSLRREQGRWCWVQGVAPLRRIRCWVKLWCPLTSDTALQTCTRAPE